MFNNSAKKEMSNRTSSPTPSPSGGHSLNSIVQGTSIEGTVKADSDIRIDGTIKGNLFCDAKIIIGPTGKIDGEIRCANAVIEGKFDGKMTVNELLNIRETAAVSGDVICGKLIVQPGGTIDGTLTMASTGKQSIAGSAKKMNQEQKTEKVA